jgi:hypothetical protein
MTFIVAWNNGVVVYTSHQQLAFFPTRPCAVPTRSSRTFSLDVSLVPVQRTAR